MSRLVNLAALACSSGCRPEFKFGPLSFYALSDAFCRSLRADAIQTRHNAMTCANFNTKRQAGINRE